MDKEREFNSEVRGRTLNTVLEAHQSPDFRPYVLEACREKLNYCQVSSIMKRQKKWLEHTLLRKIGASAASGQRLVSSMDRDVDERKARLTWATSDRFIHLVARGTARELEPFVANVEEFIEKRKTTRVVVVDATALWVKLRGEERVFISDKEQRSREARKRVAKRYKQLDREDPEKGSPGRGREASIPGRVRQRQGPDRRGVLECRRQVPSHVDQRELCRELV